MPCDVNEEFSTFHEKVSKCVRNHVPLTKLHVSHKKISLHSKPWISVRIEHMIDKRDKSLRKFNRTKVWTWNTNIKSLEIESYQKLGKVKMTIILNTLPNIKLFTLL